MLIEIFFYFTTNKSMITAVCKRLIQDMCRFSALVYHDPDTMKTLFDQQQEPVLQRFSESPPSLSPQGSTIAKSTSVCTPQKAEKKGVAWRFEAPKGFGIGCPISTWCVYPWTSPTHPLNRWCTTGFFVSTVPSKSR